MQIVHKFTSFGGTIHLVDEPPKTGDGEYSFLIQVDYLCVP